VGNPSPEERDPACLDERTIAAFVDGRLEGAALAGAEAHVAGCFNCAALVADVAHGLSAGARSGGGHTGVQVAAEVGAALGLPKVGDVVADKYEIEEAVGKGGMGAVFAARHRELGHRVAIKVLFRASRRKRATARTSCASSTWAASRAARRTS